MRAAATLAGGALVLFHLWLFAGRLLDVSIVEPRVLASWLASAALGLFALFLKRRGLPLASGRSGLVFWLLVLLLHLGMVPAAAPLPALELTLGLGLEAAAVAFALALLLGGAATADPGARPARARSTVAPLRRLALAGGPLAAPRPPPVR